MQNFSLINLDLRSTMLRYKLPINNQLSDFYFHLLLLLIDCDKLLKKMFIAHSIRRQVAARLKPGVVYNHWVAINLQHGTIWHYSKVHAAIKLLIPLITYLSLFSLSCSSSMNRQHLQLSAIFFYLIVFVDASGWMACPELSPALRLPCKCQMEQISVNGQASSVGMDCDRIVFTTDTPQIPLGAPITTFSQRYSGQQALPTQVRLSLEEIYDDGLSAR